MAPYIEREAALALVRPDDPTDVKAAVTIATAKKLVRKVLKDTPAADVAPVVHGHWIWHEEDFEYECSACHCRFDYNHTFEIFDHVFQYANWCPNCGARMDGGADNEAD